MKRKELYVRIVIIVVTLLALCSPASAQTIDRRVLGCIAHVVYGEARGEPLKDQLVIAWSVILRALLNLKYFGGSDICDVAYKNTPDRWEYDGANKKLRDIAAWGRSLAVAEMVLLGIGRPKQFITYFCNPTISKCSWHGRALTKVSIGNTGGQHRYYIDPRLQVPAHLASYR